MEAIPEKTAKGKKKDPKSETEYQDPIQMEMDFGKKHREVAKKEIEKDFEKLMLMLDKWAVPIIAVNEIISIVYSNSLRLEALRDVK